MKVEKKNMNQESIISIKEFREKQVQTNIKIHILVLSMLIFINICLIVFIISYKYKINHLKSKNTRNSCGIINSKNYLENLENSLLHKVVNIFAMSFNGYGNPHFSFLFETSEEVQSMKKSISTFTSFTAPYLHLIYESNIDGDHTNTIMNLLEYWTNLLFVIGSKSGEKFGFFIQESVLPARGGYFISNTNKCFIYSFMNKKEYPCSDRFMINTDNFLNIGNGDIIVKHDFKTNGGEINYPFKTFNIPETENEFKNSTRKFEIKDIEIYIVFDIGDY